MRFSFDYTIDMRANKIYFHENHILDRFIQSNIGTSHLCCHQRRIWKK